MGSPNTCRLVYTAALATFLVTAPALFLTAAPADADEDLQQHLTKKPVVGRAAREYGWHNSLNVALGYSQNTFSNWEPGGTSALSWLFGVTADFDFHTEKHAWMNDVRFDYGLTKQTGQELRKSVDLSSYETIYVRVFNYFVEPYAAAGAATQIAVGRDYEADPVGPPDRNASYPATSRFADPLYLHQAIGVGRQVRPEFSTRAGLAFVQIRTDLFRRYGCTREERETLELEERDRLCDDFRVKTGLESVTKYNRTFRETTNLRSTLRLFFNFEQTDQLNVVWTTTLSAEILKYITFEFGLDLVHNRDVREEVQIRQIMAIGLNFAML